MAKHAENFVCQDCGAAYRKWQGRCDACGAWNRIIEEAAPAAVPKGLSAGKGKTLNFASLTAQPEKLTRSQTGLAEFDRVLGGGLVPGSAILIGGDPGIGKSTLLLQASAQVARRGITSVYISGEEAVGQIGMRAQRLGLADAPVKLASANSLRDILAGIEAATPKDGSPVVIVIDSIQTIFADNIDSAPGTVNQVRACSQELIRAAKRSNAVVFLVGHVTKDGQIAGPRVVEHMVDTVLYFEGERGHQFRILRAVKNRFGATDEIGVFSMTDGGLAEVANPSALFLGGAEDAGKTSPISGAAVLAGMEGTRPLLVEIQALVAPSPLATPRRTVVGWDSSRLAMVLAVLDARCGLRFAGCDVFLNVAGGLRVVEPAADLAVAAALLSALADSPAPARSVFFGEVSLAGEVRPVSQAEARLKEAAKLGFHQAIMPAGLKSKVKGIKTVELVRLSELVELFPEARQAAKRQSKHGAWAEE
ncbi:DNA repair protein RadA [Ferrovibrio sp.]|uniref:DNA repair protein RadA n=1 Tax=Ferrovibrio sp. TaxID=1917215 RepID=UPI001B583077|nr:DNA repair protein RadA [Ferrovibrio sp.]MBP7064889.1 DNA repair protein RadA [Ferrovibrio sp.]